MTAFCSFYTLLILNTHFPAPQEITADTHRQLPRQSIDSLLPNHDETFFQKNFSPRRTFFDLPVLYNQSYYYLHCVFMVLDLRLKELTGCRDDSLCSFYAICTLAHSKKPVFG